jgi:hypothetical protein
LDYRVVDAFLKMASAPWQNLKWGFSYWGESLIDRARAIAATDFLDNNRGDILLFIDDDIIFQPADVYQIVQDVLLHKTIVGAPYQIKNTTEKRLALAYLDSEPICVGPGGGIREVRYCSTGFFAIPRDLLLELAKTLPRLDTGAGLKEDGSPKVPLIPFFQPMWRMDDKVYLSEDYSCCERARCKGYKIYVDSSIVLRHLGTCEYWGGEAH